MKIAYLVAQFPKPSETFVSRELLSLRKLGLELKPFAFHHPTSDETAKLDPVTRGLVKNVQYISNRQLLPTAIRSINQVRRAWPNNTETQNSATFKSNPHLRLLRTVNLARRLQKEGINHLHAHWPYATQVATQIHHLTGIPFSVSIHAHEVEHDYGHFPKAFQSLSFASFCNQAAMERLLTRLPHEARQRCHLIYHGVDLDRFPTLPFPQNTSPIRIISAGRLTKTKGFDRLIRACARFKSSGGKVELTILGQGAIDAELKQIAAQKNFSENLQLPGWLPHDQVSERIGQAHLFALMANTNFHDGLPNVLLEAMASARPVILSPLPAAAEAVDDGVEGYILERADDEQGFAHILSQIQNDPSHLPAMGQAARRRMENVFDEMIHARKLKALFLNQPITEPALA